MPVTPLVRERLASTTIAPDPLVFSSEGFRTTQIVFDAPGAGKSYTYTIEHRNPAHTVDGAEKAASGWCSFSPAATSTVSGTAAASHRIVGDHGGLRITFSSPSGSPAYRVTSYHTD